MIKTALLLIGLMTSNLAVNQFGDLVIVMGTEFFENLRVVGVNKHRFATEYDLEGTYTPFKWE